MNKEYAKQIINQATPTFIGQQLVNANTVADTLMIGHISVIQLASLGIGINIYVSLYIPFMGILLGLIPLLSQANGGNNFIKVASLTRQGLWLSLVFSVIAILFLLSPGLFLAITRSTQNVDEAVRNYLIATAFGMPAILLCRVYFAFFSGILKPHFVVYINLITLIVKLALNVMLIFWLLPRSQSAMGCAIATSIVSWLAVIISFFVIKIHHSFKRYNIKVNLPWLDFKEQWEILKIGIPIGVTFVIDYTFFTLTSLFIARFGTTSAAANQIAGNLCYLIYLVPLSISTSISALTARQIGANNPLGAKDISDAALKLGGVISLTLGACFIIFNHLLASFYTSDPNTLILASSLLTLIGVYHFFDALLTITAGALRGYKKTLIPTVIFAVTSWPIGLGGGYFLAFRSHIPYLQGPHGFWVALIISVSVAGILMFTYYTVVAANQKKTNAPNYAYGH